MEFETIIRNFSASIWIALTSLVACYMLVVRRKLKKLPPGPRGLPLVGYLPFLGSHPAAKYATLAETYGPIISVNIGTKTVVVLNNYDVILEALVKKGHAFSGRPHSRLLFEITQGHGIVFRDFGAEYRSQRKFAMMTLREFGLGKRSMEDRILEEVGYLIDVIKAKDGSSFNCEVLNRRFDKICFSTAFLNMAMNFQQTLVNAVSNVICNIVMGSRFSYDDKVFLQMTKSLNRPFGEDALLFAILIIASSLRIFPPFYGAYKRIVADYRYVIGKLTEIVEEHRKTLDVENVRDFIDQYLKQMSIRGCEDPSFNEIQLYNAIYELFIAGTETTSSSVRWCVLSLATYPHIQEKVAKEIKDVIGEAIPMMQHRTQMPYTCAFLQEIMRHRTPTPLSIPHKTSTDVTIRGFHIPKETTVFPNIWAVHHDPEHFRDPEEFRPERFIDIDGRFIEDRRVIPFSVGPRYCLGEQLAKMELFLMITSIAQRFKVVCDPDKPLPDFHSGVRGITEVPLPFEVTFQQR